MIVFLTVVAVVVWLLARRRKRQRVLAGLVATKPTFMVEPPRRQLSRGSGERL